MNDIEKYYQQYQIYQTYIEKSSRIDRDMEDTANSLSKAQKELAQCERRLQEEKKVELPDFQTNAKIFTKEANQKIDALQKDYLSNVKKIKAEAEKKYQDNDELYQKSINDIRKTGFEYNNRLTSDQENCLEYTKRKYELEDEIHQSLKKLQDQIADEKLQCLQETNAFIVKQQKNEESYDARISSQQSKIDDITDRYTEPIAKKDSALLQAEEEKKTTVEAINQQIKLRKEEWDDAQDNYEDRIQDVKRLYSTRIMKARLSGGDIEKIEHARDVKIKGLNDSLKSEEDRYHVDLKKLEDSLRSSSESADQMIASARKAADQTAADRAEELAQPQMLLESLMAEKQQRLSYLQRAIDARNKSADEAVQHYQAEMKLIESRRNEEMQKLENELRQYAEMTENGFAEILSNAYTPFLPLEKDKNKIQAAINQLSPSVSAQKAQDIYNQAYQDLASLSYEQLSELASSCKSMNLAIPPLYKKPIYYYAGSIIIALIIGIFTFYFVNTGLIGSAIISMVSLAACIIIYIRLLRKKLYILDTALALGSEYKNFNAIRSYSANKAIADESKRVQALGEKLFNGIYGEERAERLHEETKENIKQDYERAMRSAKQDAVSRNNEILKERNDRVSGYRAECRTSLTQHRNAIDAKTRQLVSVESKCRTLNQRLNEQQRNKGELEKWHDGFENMCRTMKFDDLQGETGAMLSDSVYLIAEDSTKVGETIFEKPRDVYRLVYDQKPIVILYDSDEIQRAMGEDAEAARKRTVEDILKTMLMAVKRVNPVGLFKQFVCNDPEVPDSFNNDEAKKKMSIKAVVQGIESLQSAIDKNDTMIAFAHIVIEPDQKEMTDPTTIKNAIPFYICEKNEWLDGQNSDTVYSRIRETVDNSCIIEMENGNIILNQ